MQYSDAQFYENAETEINVLNNSFFYNEMLFAIILPFPQDILNQRNEQETTVTRYFQMTEVICSENKTA